MNFLRKISTSTLPLIWKYLWCVRFWTLALWNKLFASLRSVEDIPLPILDNTLPQEDVFLRTENRNYFQENSAMYSSHQPLTVIIVRHMSFKFEFGLRALNRIVWMPGAKWASSFFPHGGCESTYLMEKNRPGWSNRKKRFLITNLLPPIYICVRLLQFDVNRFLPIW